MKKNIVFVILLIVITTFVGGCASLFKGGNEEVSFVSTPDKAKVYVNGQYIGDTPIQLNLASNKNYTIEFRKDYYLNKTVFINSNVGAGWIVLDILGGFLPVVIDATTGSWMQLDQTNINAALEKQQ